MKIGIQELLVVFIVALIVVGPDKLPYYAKKLGQAFGQFRRYTEEATKDIRESVVEPLNEAQRPLREAMEPVTELEKDVRKNVNKLKKSISDIGKPSNESAGDAQDLPSEQPKSRDAQDLPSGQPEPVGEQDPSPEPVDAQDLPSEQPEPVDAPAAESSGTESA